MEKIYTISKDVEVTAWYCDFCEREIGNIGGEQTKVKWGSGCVCGKHCCKDCFDKYFTEIGWAHSVCNHCAEKVGVDLIKEYNIIYKKYSDMNREIDIILDAIKEENE